MSEEKKAFRFTKENMARGVRPDHWWNRGLQLTEAQIREAMANTRSNKEAAKATFDEVTGKSLFGLHKNEAGRGIPRNWVGGKWKANLDEMLIENQPINSKKILRLKEMLLRDGRLGYQCCACKFSEKRLTDMKAPLLLNFKNGKKSDWRIENLEWLCYNCHFLFIGDIFNNQMMARVESYPFEAPEIKQDLQQVYQLADEYYDHLRKLGLENDGAVRFKDVKADDLIDYNQEDDLIDYRK